MRSIFNEVQEAIMYEKSIPLIYVQEIENEDTNDNHPDSIKIQKLNNIANTNKTIIIVTL